MSYEQGSPRDFKHGELKQGSTTPGQGAIGIGRVCILKKGESKRRWSWREEVPPRRGEQNQAQCVKHSAAQVSMRHRVSAICSFLLSI